MKVVAYAKRRMAPKGATDLADLRRLLLADPAVRADPQAVVDAIGRVGGGEDALRAWEELAAAPLVSDEDVDEGY